MKKRVPYLLATIVAMLLGLCSRKFADFLPTFVVDHFGDALWASMIYFGIRTLWVNKGLKLAVLISFLFCFGIEFSQLYQADWINRIRDTVLGALVLGSGFLTIDLIRYSFGIVISLLVDRYFIKRGGRG